MNLFDPNPANRRPATPSSSNQASSDFERAVFKAFWRDVLHFLDQEKNRLLPFNEIRAAFPLHGQAYIGLRQVPLDQIVGSESRYLDFDRAFLPRQVHTRQRWINIDRAHIESVELPPVELYKIGEAYFVKDGNHRVSVARDRGQAFIDAYVVEIQVPVPISSGTNLRDLVLKREQAAFLQRTRLGELRPENQIELTLPGQYDQLWEHISVHHYFLGLQEQKDVAVDTAVVSWYDRVYLPLVSIIAQRQILQEFPGRTEADLYLWIMEHRFYLGETFQDEVSLEQAADNFAREYSRRPLRRLRKALQRLRQWVARLFSKHS